MPEILTVIPTLNEVDNLARTVGRVRQHLPYSAVLIIDDGSEDGTAALADKLAGEDPDVQVMHRSERGFASAMVDAFRYAIEHHYLYVVAIDADGSFDLECLDQLVRTTRLDDLDLVIGSRWAGGDVKNVPLRRRVHSFIGNRLGQWLLSTDVKDLTSPTRVYSTKILKKVPLGRLETSAYAFQVDVLVRIAQAGGHIRELPIAYAERSMGKSKMRAQESVQAFRSVTGWFLRGVRARPDSRKY